LQYACMHHLLAICGVKMPRPRLLVMLFCGARQADVDWGVAEYYMSEPWRWGGPLLAALSQGAGDGAAHADGMLRTSRLLFFRTHTFSLDLRIRACHHRSSTPDL
jgi:hypothetical protein